MSTKKDIMNNLTEQEVRILNKVKAEFSYMGDDALPVCRTMVNAVRLEYRGAVMAIGRGVAVKYAA